MSSRGAATISQFAPMQHPGVLGQRAVGGWAAGGRAVGRHGSRIVTTAEQGDDARDRSGTSAHRLQPSGYRAGTASPPGLLLPRANRGSSSSAMLSGDRRWRRYSNAKVTWVENVGNLAGAQNQWSILLRLLTAFADQTDALGLPTPQEF